MANSIAAIKNYTTVLDRIYQREATSSCLSSPARMARAGRNAKEIMIPRISATGLGDYTRNVGYKTGSIDFAYETKAFNYDRGIKLLADVMDVEEAGVLDCFVQAGAELQRTQVPPEADAFTYATIASHEGVAVTETDLSNAKATDVLAALCKVTNTMDEAQVTPGSRYLFITPTLKGVLDYYSLANPNMSNRVLTRFCCVVEVPQARFYTEMLHIGGGDSSGSSPADPSLKQIQNSKGVGSMLSCNAWLTVVGCTLRLARQEHLNRYADRRLAGLQGTDFYASPPNQLPVIDSHQTTASRHGSSSRSFRSDASSTSISSAPTGSMTGACGTTSICCRASMGYATATPTTTAS